MCLYWKRTTNSCDFRKEIQVRIRPESFLVVSDTLQLECSRLIAMSIVNHWMSGFLQVYVGQSLLEEKIIFFKDGFILSILVMITLSQ